MNDINRSSWKIFVIGRAEYIFGWTLLVNTVDGYWHGRGEWSGMIVALIEGGWPTITTWGHPGGLPFLSKPRCQQCSRLWVRQLRQPKTPHCACFGIFTEGEWNMTSVNRGLSGNPCFIFRYFVMGNSVLHCTSNAMKMVSFPQEIVFEHLGSAKWMRQMLKRIAWTHLDDGLQESDRDINPIACWNDQWDGLKFRRSQLQDY